MAETSLMISLAPELVGSDRPVDGGKDTVGWYPLFGVTHCSESELANINKIRGRSVAQCGDNDQGGLIDNILNPLYIIKLAYSYMRLFHHLNI